MSKEIEPHLIREEEISPSPAFRERARVGAHEDYKTLYQQSLEEPDVFWREQMRELIVRTPFHTFVEWNAPRAKFFQGATLNVSESCLDRHLETNARHRAAIVWEGEPGDTRTLTYFDLHREVVQLAAALLDLGVEAGDRVILYMGMVPETVVAMLACARIGAPHSVIFGGFSTEAIRERIADSGARVLFTQDGAWRRGQVIPLKETVDRALSEGTAIEKVIVYRRIAPEGAPITTHERDIDWRELVTRSPSAASLQRALCPEAFAAEHPLFLLYTSGSTGKPKGVLHTSAGYLAGVHVSTKYIFDLRDSDLYWCTADVGWITGHSYLVYGPLSVGASCMMYEGAPNYPDAGRFWNIIERHGVSVLYTAPTAIRAFIRSGDEWPNRYNLSSLRLLGSVGEPINPEVWHWYHKVIGGGRCPIVDTWWQTETGSIMLTTLPGAMSAKAGWTGLPFFGVEPAVVNESGDDCSAGEEGKLIIKRPWPSMARTLWNDDARYAQVYWSAVPNAYFTGDGAQKDDKGYYRIGGRIDDVLNIAGHRIGTAEIESALVSHPDVAEAAAVGKPDALKGQALIVFVILKSGVEEGETLSQALRDHVAQEIGKFARPDELRFANTLPKTRSGKIMRRLLRLIAAGDSEASGDLSTLEDARVFEQLIADP